MSPPHWMGRLAWGLAAVWTILVATSLLWNCHQIRQTALELASTQAHLSYNKDLVYRLWAAGHGGVYVPVTPQTQPNPYLSHIPERDIQTPSGRALTLMNPAYMTRQVHELAAQVYGIKGHLTSLKPIRQENAPDAWEAKALKAFETGIPEITEVVELAGEPHLRFMRPWRTEKACLKCHAAQGYKEGDIRGGISLDVPLKPFLAGIKAQTFPLAAGHGLIWVLGLCGIIMGNRRIMHYLGGRQQAEETLREREAKYRAAIETSGDGFCIADNSGRFLEFNDSYVKMLAYSRGELLNMSVPDIEAQLTATEIAATLEKARREGHVIFETKLRSKDGRVWPAELNLSYWPIGGGRAFVFLRDITKRKQAEEALRRAHDELEQRVQERTAQVRRQAEEIQDLYDNAPCGYHSLDAAGVFVRINNTELEWLGYTRDEVIGRLKFSDIMTAESQEKFLETFPDFIKQGRVEGLEYELVCRDGTSLPVLLNATAVTDDAGNFLMSRATVFDISERKEAEEALKESEARLRYLSFRLLTSKEDVQKQIAWELHEDLAQSLMVLKMALRQALPDDSAGAKADSQVVRNQVSELIQKVRSISYSLRPPALDLGLTKALQSLLQETLGDQDMELSLNLCDLDGLFPDENQVGIYRVFQEALSNIFNHAQATHVSVTTESRDGTVWFEITDNGQGFDLKKVQGRDATDQRLGLTTMAERVRLLGGDLKISSAEGQGTTVTFKIPIIRG